MFSVDAIAPCALTVCFESEKSQCCQEESTYIDLSLFCSQQKKSKISLTVCPVKKIIA